LAAYLGKRRVRYFGNTAPLVVLALLWLMAVTDLAPDVLAYGAFPMRALVFVFVFLAGVAADLLEMPPRRSQAAMMTAAILTALLLSHAVVGVRDLARSGGSSHPFRVDGAQP
jgi:hypothetical protein